MASSPETAASCGHHGLQYVGNISSPKGRIEQLGDRLWKGKGHYGDSLYVRVRIIFALIAHSLIQWKRTKHRSRRIACQILSSWAKWRKSCIVFRLSHYASSGCPRAHLQIFVAPSFLRQLTLHRVPLHVSFISLHNAPMSKGDYAKRSSMRLGPTAKNLIMMESLRFRIWTP